MRWYDYVIFAAALFFAAGWTIGLVFSPRNRTGTNILTVILWWVLIALAVVSAFDPLHLIWAFPVALAVPAAALMARGP